MMYDEKLSRSILDICLHKRQRDIQTPRAFDIFVYILHLTWGNLKNRMTHHDMRVGRLPSQFLSLASKHWPVQFCSLNRFVVHFEGVSLRIIFQKRY